ncbi:Fic family protein [Prevotella sp.]|uniref:Fic family protein n=1 Tax=Prevotella sp. TaxID=59823 RepID=UPI0035B2EED9
MQRMNGKCSQNYTPQVPHKYPTSTPQVKDKLHTSNPFILELIKIIGDKNLSVREMLSVIGLKERKNFLDLYLNPAINEGYVCLLYPNSPRHPRQKYLLTVKGLAVYDECNKLE